MKSNLNLKQIATTTFGRMLILSLLAAGISIVGSLTAFNTVAQAQTEKDSQAEQSPEDASNRCGIETLMGNYAVIGDGFAAPPPSTPLPFATLSLMTFDGSGNLTNKVTRSNNGNISRGVDSGTYTVNADCTGTMTITTPNPPFQLTFDLVIADMQWRQGKEFYFIATTPGGAITASAKRIQ
jgi:hypothetical protein